MIWKNRGGSDNIEDRRAKSMVGGKKSMGIGTVVLVLASLYFGIDPSIVLNMTSNQSPSSVSAPYKESAQERNSAAFVSTILADTERFWHKEFAKYGKRYKEPKLVLFRGSVNSGCGYAKAQMGPFYCPADSKVYIDLSFFDELKRRHNSPGDFAQAYVIAHEIGHHVQSLIGVSNKVHQAKQRVSKKDANVLSVKQELQADCFSGMWASGMRNALERGDIEEALRAANNIGDDTLQKQATGHVVPDSFTHGSGVQRERWFYVGFEKADMNTCDTFNVSRL